MPKFRKEPQQPRRGVRKNPRHRILIVCEGMTEYLYFTALKKAVVKLATLIIVKTKANQSGFKAIIKTALAERQDDPAPTFCVCDHDGRPDWQTTCQQMRDRGLTPIISFPCFEYWLLLHFAYTDKPFSDCTQAESELKRHVPNYDKTSPQIMQLLAGRIATAKANAAALYGDKDACAQTAGSSYTNLHTVAEFLQTIAPRSTNAPSG